MIPQFNSLASPLPLFIQLHVKITLILTTSNVSSLQIRIVPSSELEMRIGSAGCTMRPAKTNYHGDITHETSKIWVP